MSVRLAIVAAVAALVAAVLPAPSGATRECAGIQDCISVPGPWVDVPAQGGATFLLECPQRQGIVGGLDAEASSRDVRITFDGLLGSPVSPGTTTMQYAVFRAVSAAGRHGAFRPFLGCIPVSGGGRSTTSARAATPGPPVDRVASLVRLRPGTRQQAVQACPTGEHVVGSWSALAFGTDRMPRLALASAVKVRLAVRGERVVASIDTGPALPASARAEVQVGAECAGP